MLTWREVLPHDPCQRIQVEQTLGGSGSQQGSQGRQDSDPELYPKQGTEASPTASGITSGLYLQCDSRHPSDPYSVEARPRDLYT